MVKELEIVPWVQIRDHMDLDRYRFQLENPPIMRGRTFSTEELSGREEGDQQNATRLAEVQRFAPKSEAMFFETPSGKPFTGFRSVGRNWVTVFATVPDPDLASGVEVPWWNLLVPIVVEWKHGAEVTVIGPVCGEPKPGESPKDAALREFKEETGFELADVVRLAPEGLAVSARQSTQTYIPLLGTVQEPVTRGEAKLDKTEHLKLVLVRLSAWVDFILSGFARDDNAYATTFLALINKMRLLQVGSQPYGMTFPTVR